MLASIEPMINSLYLSKLLHVLSKLVRTYKFYTLNRYVTILLCLTLPDIGHRTARSKGAHASKNAYLLTPYSRVLLEKLAGLCSQSRNSPHFTEPEGSLPHSQVPTTCLYPESTQSSPYPHILLLEEPA
jgi:hypothetical protein